GLRDGHQLLQRSLLAGLRQSEDDLFFDLVALFRVVQLNQQVKTLLAPGLPDPENRFTAKRRVVSGARDVEELRLGSRVIHLRNRENDLLSNLNVVVRIVDLHQLVSALFIAPLTEPEDRFLAYVGISPGAGDLAEFCPRHRSASL